VTKKDYVKIALAFLSEKPGKNWNPNKLVQWELDLKAITNVLASDNPRFDRARFYKACGMDGRCQ
jgi:hypothetical protein